MLEVGKKELRLYNSTVITSKSIFMNIISFNNNSQDVIQTAVKVLQDGGLVIFPSDTVYGLLVDATNPAAVQKLINFKNRPPGKAISVFVKNLEMLNDEVEVSDKKKELLQQMLPGPFTIILPSKHKVSKLLESEKGTLGVRVPNYQLVLDLVAVFGKPITATSANLGGRPPHYSIESLLNEIPESKKELIDLIVDAGKLPRNKPSTIVDLTESEVKILRHGDIVTTDEETFTTDAPIQTRKVAHYILEKVTKKLQGKPLVVILEGDLGTGKTQFVKGVAEYIGIEEKIISPTFVIYYEYDAPPEKGFNKLVHYDLYNIMDKDEFKDIGIAENLKEGTIMCMEWGDKSGEVIGMLKVKAKMVFIKISYLNEEKRKIEVKV